MGGGRAEQIRRVTAARAGGSLGQPRRGGSQSAVGKRARQAGEQASFRLHRRSRRQAAAQERRRLHRICWARSTGRQMRKRCRAAAGTRRRRLVALRELRVASRRPATVRADLVSTGQSTRLGGSRSRRLGSFSRMLEEDAVACSWGQGPVALPMREAFSYVGTGRR